MGETLTKAKLVAAIKKNVGLSRKDADFVIDELINQLRTSLQNGEKVKISGFGNFVVRDKAARRGRNPRTNEEIIISRRRVVTFKPSQVLRGALNKGR